jgi:hypothetical protein
MSSGFSQGGIMVERATYRNCAEECRRLAATASENDQRLLLEHAAAWLKLAEEAEHESDDEAQSSMRRKKVGTSRHR